MYSELDEIARSFIRPKSIEFPHLWSKIKVNLDLIFSPSEKPTISGMELFELFYDCCTSNLVEKLLESILNYLMDFCKNVTQSIIVNVDKSFRGAQSRLEIYANKWILYKSGIEKLNRASCYFNKCLVNLAKKKDNVSERTILLLDVKGHACLVWQSNVLYELKVNNQNSLVHEILAFITSNRDGNTTPDALIRVAIESYESINFFQEYSKLSVYIEEFEVPYMAHLSDYYEHEAQALLKKLSVQDYIKQVDARFNKEVDRTRQYLHPNSLSKAVFILETQFIDNHLSFLKQNFNTMIEKEQVDHCTIMYGLLVRIRGALQDSILYFEHLVEKQVYKIASDVKGTILKESSEYFNQLLKLRQHYLTFAKAAVGENSAFDASIDKGFRTVFSEQTDFPYPEALSKYLDTLMKKSKTEDPDSNDTLQEGPIFNILKLFDYINDKDIFQKFYTRYLAKRLIYNSFKSMELEQNVILKLRENRGFDYTQKMQKMLTDITLSNETSVQFGKSSFLNFDFKCLVLTSGSWPMTVEKVDFAVPAVIQEAISKFSTYYIDTLGREGRKLIWNHSLSRGEVRLTYLDKRYELQISLKQLAVLLLFNNSTELDLVSMKNQVGINEAELESILSAIVEMGLLLKKETLYTINREFTSKRIKLKLAPTPQLQDSKETQVDEKGVVDQDRVFLLQAIIVRVMKGLKTSTHAKLLHETIKQCQPQFLPSVPVIKKCIESLIEKGYMKRSDTDRQTYIYLY